MLPLLLPLISLLIQVQCLTVKSQPVPLNQICSNVTGNFTVNGSYAVNLDRLISCLSSLGFNENGLYNISLGDSDGKVNSISLCRGDVKSEDCINCVAMAAKRLVTLCPVQKEAVIWYDKCTVRYSNRTLFDRLEIYPQTSVTGTRNFTGDRDGWEKSLRGLLEGLKDKASMVGRRKKNFVVGETVGPMFQTLYGLVQCTPDISEEDCSYCVSQGIAKIPSCCDMKMGSYVLSPSCMVAYAPWRFYNSVDMDHEPKNETTQGDKNRGVPKALIFAAVSVALVVFIIMFLVFFLRFRKKKKKISNGERKLEDISTDSMRFDFNMLQDATSQFSLKNKLGEGGFGAVYKGVLCDGQEIAVKRLSKNAQQGETEFKNEFLLVAKLQRRNLVKLLGYAIEGTDRLLVYEFLTHASLDKFIFDPIQGKELEWEIRYKIIGGVARGLVYLHQDSRLRIIHRDLKASNILLDDEMTPKIADFGLAKLFDIDHTTQCYTNRVVGTFGYMAPEYVKHGQFSFKTDVYSFGVLVLEIISGKKNSCFSVEDSMEDLISYAWRNWKEGVALNLVDKMLMTMSSYSSNIILRCINIGLLCVQEKVSERPNMASVLMMLDGHTLALSEPSNPAFFTHGNLISDTSSSLGHNAKTSNYNSNTELYPR